VSEPRFAPLAGDRKIQYFTNSFYRDVCTLRGPGANIGEDMDGFMRFEWQEMPEDHFQKVMLPDSFEGADAMCRRFYAWAIRDSDEVAFWIDWHNIGYIHRNTTLSCLLTYFREYCDTVDCGLGRYCYSGRECDLVSAVFSVCCVQQVSCFLFSVRAGRVLRWHEEHGLYLRSRKGEYLPPEGRWSPVDLPEALCVFRTI
jgi:hypothetical protein